jgi:CyaY protein
MERKEFLELADKTLDSIVAHLDKIDYGDTDVVVSDGKLVIEFVNGVTLIINRQGGSSQIWLAEPNGGWHYDYKDGRWIDDKRGVDLITSLEELISENLGQPVKLQ